MCLQIQGEVLGGVQGGEQAGVPVRVQRWIQVQTERTETKILAMVRKVTGVSTEPQSGVLGDETGREI